jgi:hypothetical protein
VMPGRVETGGGLGQRDGRRDQARHEHDGEEPPESGPPMPHDTFRLSRTGRSGRGAGCATPLAACARSAVQPADRLGRDRLWRDGLDATRAGGSLTVRGRGRIP